MKLKAIITSILFLGAVFAGSALAEELQGFHKADKLKDQSVMNQEGEELGTIDNLLISDEGQVFIVLSRADNGDMVPVPWEAANLYKGEDDKLTSSITEQQLEGAPSFADYAELSSPGYEQEVHSYFGTESRMQEPFGVEQDSPIAPSPETPN